MAKRCTAEYLVQAFAKKIMDGSWPLGEPVPALRTMAARFGVARATMDAAVRQAVELGLLRTEPRRAVRVPADGLAAARSLLDQVKRSGRRIKIAILTADHEQSTQPEDHESIVAHVMRRAATSGWTAARVYWPLGRRGNFPRFLADQGFDGAFCLAVRSERMMPLHFMRQRNFPIVVYNRRFAYLPLPTVMFDEYGAVQQLGKLLHTLGHRRITLLVAPGGADGRFDSPQINGWLDFCRQQDLLAIWDEPMYFLGHPDAERALAAFFRRRPLPTAVILGGGRLVSALHGLPDLDLRVPEDVSIVATHCSPESCPASRFPPITCMKPNMERMAECGLELLARMIDGEPYPPPLRLPYALVRTDSVAAPRSD